MNKPNNILDMYVVYLSDDNTERQNRANELVVLTCSTYAVFDDRSTSERARVPTEQAVDQIERDAYRSCNALIVKLAGENDIKSLRLIQSRLAKNECLDNVTRILSERKEDENRKHKIKI